MSKINLNLSIFQLILYTTPSYSGDVTMKHFNAQGIQWNSYTKLDVRYLFLYRAYWSFLVVTNFTGAWKNRIMSSLTTARSNALFTFYVWNIQMEFFNRFRYKMLLFKQTLWFSCLFHTLVTRKNIINNVILQLFGYFIYFLPISNSVF